MQREDENSFCGCRISVFSKSGYFNSFMETKIKQVRYNRVKRQRKEKCVSSLSNFVMHQQKFNDSSLRGRGRGRGREVDI